MISDYIDYNNGEMSRNEFIGRIILTGSEFAIPIVATGLAAVCVIGAPVLAGAIIVTGVITAVDAAGGFDSLFYDENNRKP